MTRARLATGAAFAAAVLAVLALSSVLAASPSNADVPPVGEDYLLHCSACHGPDGAGVAARVPSLYETGLIVTRPGGRDYLMRVPGAAQSPLDDARLARLLGWIVEEFGGTPLAAPFTSDEVGRARIAPLRDPAAARSSLFAQ